MVKADAKRDYYADLELPSTADTEEIKKQFRLLAKQYHPDRNPGHEVEFVPKFQAVQAAHEVLADPTERAKYDAARAKLARTNNPPPPPQSAPQSRDADPYNFRKPTYRSSPQGNAPPNPVPPPPQTPRTRPAYTQKQQSSAGAEKFNAFTRPMPQWDRARFEEATRAEAAQRFQNMRPAQTTQMPPPPPRPARPHPTAPRPQTTTPSADLPNAPNGVPPGFPGLSRTASGRRVYQGPSVEDPAAQRTSAYAYVRGDRPPSATTQNYTPDSYSGYSPPLTKARPAASPLRHTKSHDQGSSTERPYLGRTSSKYAANLGERTDIHGGGLGRSASVRGSPIDRKWDDSGPFGRPHSQTGPPPPRHRSESPNARPEPTGIYAEQSSSSGSSGDEKPDIRNRRKAAPRVGRGRATTNDGLEGQFPNTNYTRVKTDTNEPYAYPPPEPKYPTREPFPDMTSPDDVISPSNPFSNSEPKRPDPETVFHPAKFSAEDWAERLRSMSPTKRGSKSKRPPRSKSDHSPDAMDVDSAETNHEKQPHTNGVNLDDLKKEAPFASTGLGGFDDIATNLPFQSRPSGKINLERTTSARLRSLNLPRPPKPVNPPARDKLTQENWQQYVRNMNLYMREWSIFQAKMIAHFQTRHEIVDHGMSDNWISKASDGPDAAEVDMNGSVGSNGVPRAGYAAYMSWLDDDTKCHAWWDRAAEEHRACMEDLGRVREVIKSDLS